MGGGGSIQNMINTLKSNKLMLNKRKGYFKRELDYKQLRKFYKDSLSPIGNKTRPTKEELAIIRIAIIKAEKQSFRRQLITAILVVIVLGGLFFYLLKSYGTIEKKNTTRRSVLNEPINKVDPYKKNMQLGFEQLKNKNYFFAIGNFETALYAYPSDSAATYNLAKAYCLLCAQKKMGCKEANEMIEKRLIEQPDNSNYLFLKANYLVNTEHFTP